MKIQELVEKLSQNEVIELNTLIQFKSYISFAEKTLICNNIIEASLEKNDDDILTCNYFHKKLMTDISIITHYTDIEMSDKFLQDYDTLCKYDIINIVLDNINKNDKEFILQMVDKSIEQQIKISNSLESVIAKTLNNLISKIPDEKSLNKMMANMSKNLNKIKPENLNMMKELFSQNKVQNFMGDLSKDMVKNDGIEVTE